MAKRIAPIRVISFFLLAACGAWCQSERADLVQGLQFDGSNSPEVPRPETRTWRSLPDAPSTVQPRKQAEKFQTCVDGVRPSLALGAVGINTGVMRGTELRNVTPGPQPSYAAPHNAVVAQEEFHTFFGKYLVSVVAQAEPALSPFQQRRFYGPGHVRRFAHFYHA